ncbi:MAG: MarR family transcriptional regulator [Rhizobiaceae bacterium]|nr:MarR family transcriptional regulator [Rhizobiaceae bacterium]
MVEDIVRSFGYLTLGTRMRRIGERLQADAQKIIDSCGQTIQGSQYPFLASIDRLGPLTIGELAEAVGITQPGTTRAVNQLVQLGLVETRPSPEDQRRRIVALSTQGQEIVDAARRDVWPSIREAVADLCDGLEGPLLEQLTAMENGLATTPLDRRLGKDGADR